MPIVVDSSQWTGEHDDARPATPIVWGEFADRDALDRAQERLRGEAWFRDTTQGGERAPGPADNDQVITPDEHPKQADARNLRQNAVGIGAASTAMLAAGVVIATGGAALPAVGAAAAAGGMTALGGEAVGKSLEPKESGRGPQTMGEAGPALGIRAATEEVRDRAEAFLREAGAQRTWVQSPEG